MGGNTGRTLKGVTGSIVTAVLAVLITIVAVIMFLLKIGVELSFLGSIWSFVTGEWKTGLVLLIVGTLVSVFILG
jgi:ABC-type phosphate transport system permease subunit